MSKSNFYLLVSLPTSISSSADQDEAFSSLQATASKESESVIPFSIPEFKIGTLDALVQQADDLAKLEAHCEAVANKVGESLKSVLEGDENKVAQQKTVNDSKQRRDHEMATIAHTIQSRWINIYGASTGIKSNIEQTGRLEI